MKSQHSDFKEILTKKDNSFESVAITLVRRTVFLLIWYMNNKTGYVIMNSGEGFIYLFICFMESVILQTF